jgi:PAS domain S-box-containing protein
LERRRPVRGVRAALARRNRQLEAINRVSQVLAETLELDEVIGRILDEVDRGLGVTGCSVWMPEPDSGELVCYQASGPARDKVRGWRLAPGQGIAGRVLASGEPAVVADLAREPDNVSAVADEVHLELHSLLAVPLQVRGEVLGVLEAVDTRPGRFQASDLELFIPLAAVAAKALRNAQLYQQAQDEIAQRQAAEAQVRAQALLLESVHEAVVATDLAGTVTYWGPGAERLYGCAAAETVGRPISSFLCPPGGEHEALVPAVLAAGLIEFRGDYCHPDGDRTWVHATVAAVPGADGEPCGLVSVGRDITAQVEAEEALRESEARLRAQYQGHPVPTYTWQYRDGDMVLVDCNRAAEAVTDGHIRDLLGVTLSELYADRPHLRERIWRCYHEQSLGTEELLYHFKTVDKALFLRVSYVFVPPDVVMIHTEDVTERVEAQEAREISLEMTRALLDAADDAALLVELDGTIAALNAPAARRIGQPRQELVGATIYAFAPHEVIDNRREQIGAVIQSGDPLEFEDAYDGRIYSHRVQPVKNPQGRVVSLAVFSRDVTERRSAEIALRRYAQRLEILHQLDHAIAAARSPGEIARAALEHAWPLVPYDTACVRAIDLAARTWTVLASATRCTPPAVVEEPPCSLEPLADFLAVLACGGVQCIEDTARDGAAATVAAALGAPGAEAYLLAPLRVQRRLAGALFFSSTLPGTYRREHIEVVHEVANSLELAIQNARLRQAAEERSLNLEGLVAQRTSELETLYDITALASESFDLQHTMDYALDRTLAALGCGAGAIHVLEPEVGQALALLAQRNVPADVAELLAALIGDVAFRGPLLERGEPVAITDLAGEPLARALAAARYDAWIAAPLRARGEVLGVLSLFCGARGRVTVEDVALVGSIADHIGVAVQNARLYRRAQQAAALEERERLARDLHDSVAQGLYSLTLFSRAASNLVAKGRYDRVDALLDEIGAGALGTLKEMRLMLHQLRPPALEAEGLLGALRQRLEAVEERVGVETELVASTPLLDLPRALEEGLYYIAHEALNNALRHAAASRVAVRIDVSGSRVLLEVADNGCGFDGHEARNLRGMGLATMHQRAESLQGVLTVVTVPGQGTTIRFVGDTRQPVEIIDGAEGAYG